jgi:tmRNA-binding protein
MFVYLFTAHLQHLQTQPQNQQNVELEKKLRRQKEMLEQMLNQKVSINYLFLKLKIYPTSCSLKVTALV